MTVEGEGGGWRLMFFFSLHWKCGRRRGKGVNLGALEMFFSLWRGYGREGGNFFYKFIMGRGKGCKLIFFLFFFIVEGEGGGG